MAADYNSALARFNVQSSVQHLLPTVNIEPRAAGAVR